MKTLLIQRHAKSSRSDDGLADFDRPLNDRGRRDAPRMGELLRSENLVPEVIFTSSAARTLETAKLLTQAAGFEGEVVARGELYLAPPMQYVVLLHELESAYNCVLLLGHNPGVQQLVSMLAGRDLSMPTAALAWFGLPIASWTELQLASHAALRRQWKPKELRKPA